MAPSFRVCGAKRRAGPGGTQQATPGVRQTHAKESRSGRWKWLGQALGTAPAAQCTLSGAGGRGVEEGSAWAEWKAQDSAPQAGNTHVPPTKVGSRGKSKKQGHLCLPKPPEFLLSLQMPTGTSLLADHCLRTSPLTSYLP